MQKAPIASVSQGPVSPAIPKPDKDSKEIYLLSGLVLFLALVVAAFWYHSQSEETAGGHRPAETYAGAQASQVIKSQAEPAPVAVSIPTAHIVEAAPFATKTSEVQHDDIFFEVGRKGLTDDGKAALGRHAEFLKTEPDWGILLQGYTDQQGSMSYNKSLGLKRAETVKQHLMALGVAETSIRTVSLGEEGALCIDTSDICRRMNRRVHLELRKVGQEHMTVPAVVITPPAEEAQAVGEPGVQPIEVHETMDASPESATALPDSDDGSVIDESPIQTPSE